MIIEQVKDQRENIISILSAEKLPVDDLPEKLDNFLVAVENGTIMGVVGLEIYGDYGLLRSLAVPSEYRNRGIAGQLMDQLETLAGQKGVRDLFLLTETAPEYFIRKGFQTITRDEVPEEVKLSTEFSHVCPVSAIVMKKSI
jgi:amino-acid N-acetyltransferase